MTGSNLNTGINHLKTAPISKWRGIGLRVLATFLLAAMSACVHAAAKQAALGQIVFYRSLFALLPILIYAFWITPNFTSLKTSQPMQHLTRGVFGAVTMVLAFLSLAYLPVASATALAYLVPIISLPLAAHLLNERIAKPLLVAVIIGFVGVLLIVAPAFDTPELNRGILIGTAAGIGYAVLMAILRVYIKRMTDTETPVSIAFYFALICTALSVLSAPHTWPSVDIGTLVALIGAGTLGGLGHIAATEAVARAPLSVLAPFEYIGLIWAIGFDIFLFAQFPTFITLLGCALITAAAVFVLFSKRISGAA
ncbi:MAG: DMT family transporter [Paracoccaceae bacterium]